MTADNHIRCHQGGCRQRTCCRQCGFTLLELVVVISIIALLFVYAFRHIIAVEVLAEKATMENTLGSLRSALAIQFAQRIATHRLVSIAELDGENPVKFLNRPPNNYLGELEGIDPAGITGGHWYFDASKRTLVYRVKNEDYFVSALGSPARATFKVALVYEDTDLNRRFDRTRDEIIGLRLERQGDFAWTEGRSAVQGIGTGSIGLASVSQGLR